MVSAPDLHFEERLVAYFLVDGLPAPATASGKFQFTAGKAAGTAGWRWDGRELVVERSSLDFTPLYLLQEKGRFGISDSIPELLRFAGCRRLDEAAVATFLRVGSYLGDDTPFQVIRAMPPVNGLRWAEGKITLGSAFRQPERSGLTRERIKAQYQAMFRAAVERAAPTFEVVLPLTGGRDSRHILLELQAQNRLPAETFTASLYPPRNAEDMRIARSLAERVGVRHRSLSRNNRRFQVELEKNRRTSFSSIMHGWALAVSECIQGKAMFDGLGGDVLSESAKLTEKHVSLYEAGRLSDLAGDILGPRDAALRRVLGQDAYRRFPLTLARERLEMELEKFAHLHNPMTQFAFWNRARRAVAPNTFNLFGFGNEMHTPFLETELATFLLSVPTSETITKTLHTETIHESYPAFSDIPFELKSRRTPGDRISITGFLANFAAYGRQLGAQRWGDFSGLAVEVARGIATGALPDVLLQLLYLVQVLRTEKCDDGRLQEIFENH